MSDPKIGAEATTADVAVRLHVTLLVVQIVFGTFHVVGKAVLAEMPPLVLATVRVGVAAPLLVAYAWRHDRVVPRGRELLHLALLGALGVAANQVLFVIGLQYTTATNAAILMVSVPVFTVAVAALLRVERLGPRRLVGIALAVAGAAVLLDPRRLAFGRASLVGNALILTNALAYSFFLVLQRPVLRRLPWRTVIAGSFVFGGAGVLVVAVPELLALPGTDISPFAWTGALYIALVPTAAAYAANTWAVRRSSPALVAVYNTVQPLVAAVLAAAFLGERLGWAEAAGFGLIAAGLLRVSLRPPRGAVAAAAPP
jgi:drug/metabolite transporter (DMT)-like permease